MDVCGTASDYKQPSSSQLCVAKESWLETSPDPMRWKSVLEHPWDAGS